MTSYDINNNIIDYELMNHLELQMRIMNDQIPQQYRDTGFEEMVNSISRPIIESSTQTPSPGIPIAQVIWTNHWEDIGLRFIGVENIPNWFLNLEEDTYNNITINTDDISITRYLFIEPVIGKEIEY